MLNIPLYDLLCLYEFAKSKVKNPNGRNNDFFKKLCDDISKYKILYEQEDRRITISFSDDKFNKLENKNFNKKQERKNTNIGKTKKTTYGRKTYYFFGKNTKNPNKYRYACYRDGTEVYYFEIDDIKKQKDLINLQDRSALEDLKTFIILRRMKNPQDKEFGKEVYQKASEIISQLKFQEIQKKINPNQSQVQTQVQFPVQSQNSKQSKGSFSNYFKSFSDSLPSNTKQQLQPQRPSTLVV